MLTAAAFAFGVLRIGSLPALAMMVVGKVWVIGWNIQHSVDIVDDDEVWLEPLM